MGALHITNLIYTYRVHDKKLVIVALCSLLELPTETIPASLQAGWSQMLNGMLIVFKTLPKAMESKC